MTDQRVAGLGTVLHSALVAHSRTDATAFIVDDAAVTYRDLLHRIEQRLAYCAEIGSTGGELVGIVMDKTLDAVTVFLGLLLGGATPCFIEPRLTAESLAARLDSVGMRRLVTDNPDAPAFATVPGSVTTHTAHEFASLAPAPKVEPAPDDRAMMLFTSGSTGKPKGVVLTHRNLLTNARGVIEHTELTGADRLLHIMPLHHTNGVNNQIIAPLLAGATIVLERGFRPEAAVEAIRRHRPSYLTGVPTMYARMVEFVRTDDDFGFLRFLRCGSAPITPEQHRRIEEAFGVPLVLSYGMSEATCTTTMNPVAAPRPGTVGTVLREQRVRITEPGATTELPPGSDGEIRIGGPAVMPGYLGGTSSPIEDGWLRTGDIGHLTENGYLVITGRLKDIINRGGENISPAVIENAMTAHPTVADCCVVGTAHDDLGEVPIAFVSIHPDAPSPSDTELAQWISTRLGRPYVPDRIIFLDDLPTNGVGKKDRNALRTMLSTATENTEDARFVPLKLDNR